MTRKVAWQLKPNLPITALPAADAQHVEIQQQQILLQHISPTTDSVSVLAQQQCQDVEHELQASLIGEAEKHNSNNTCADSVQQQQQLPVQQPVVENNVANSTSPPVQQVTESVPLSTAVADSGTIIQQPKEASPATKCAIINDAPFFATRVLSE